MLRAKEEKILPTKDCWNRTRRNMREDTVPGVSLSALLFLFVGLYLLPDVRNPSPEWTSSLMFFCASSLALVLAHQLHTLTASLSRVARKTKSNIMYYMLEQRSMKESLLLKVVPVLMLGVMFLTLLSAQRSTGKMTAVYLLPLIMSIGTVLSVAAQTLTDTLNPSLVMMTFLLAVLTAVATLFLFLQPASETLSPSSVLGGLLTSALLLAIVTRGRAVASSATSMAMRR